MRNFNIYKFVVVAIISVAIVVALVVANTTKTPVEAEPEPQEKVNIAEEAEPTDNTEKEVISEPTKAVNTEVVTTSAKKTVVGEKIDEVEQSVVEEPAQSTPPVQYGGGRYSSIANGITQQEKDYIARLAFLEARGESDEGQRAVIEVILNRVLSGSFPNTIEGVIFQSGQFSPANLISSTTATSKEYNNLEFVLSGQAFQTDVNVVFFSTGLQQGRQVYKKIGNHYFQYL